MSRRLGMVAAHDVKALAKRLCEADAHPVAIGVVKFFKKDKGWGAISSDVLPAGRDAWVHFSTIEGDGYRSLEQGGIVDFDYEEVQQDSFDFRATKVRKV